MLSSTNPNASKDLGISKTIVHYYHPSARGRKRSLSLAPFASLTEYRTAITALKVSEWKLKVDSTSFNPFSRVQILKINFQHRKDGLLCWMISKLFLLEL